jgi:hypothetical protein
MKFQRLFLGPHAHDRGNAPDKAAQVNAGG